MVLLHGAPFTSLGFVRLIRSLRERCRVIAPDLLGFGQSAAAEAFDGSLGAHAQSVAEFMDALGLARTVLFGCDASASIGLATAAKMPSRIAGLVVADTIQIPLVGRAWPIRMLLSYVMNSRVVRFFNRRFNILPWAVATLDPFRRPFSRNERRAFVRQFDSHAKRDRVLELFVAMGRDVPFMQHTASQARARLGDKPTLLVYGQFDPMRLLGAVSYFRKWFRSSSVAIIPREKHFPYLAEGEAVGAAMKRWMSDHGLDRELLEQPSERSIAT